MDSLYVAIQNLEVAIRSCTFHVVLAICGMGVGIVISIVLGWATEN